MGTTLGARHEVRVGVGLTEEKRLPNGRTGEALLLA
jgi:hypothetical protein